MFTSASICRVQYVGTFYCTLHHLRRLKQQLEVGVLFCRKCSRQWDQDIHIAAQCSEGGSIAGFLMPVCFENWQERFIFEALYIGICYSMQLSLAFLRLIWEIPSSNFDLEVTSCHWFSSGLLADGWSTWCYIVSSFFHVLSSLLFKDHFMPYNFTCWEPH